MKNKKDGVAEALERLRKNRLKNAHEICDGIYVMEAKRSKELYDSCKLNKLTIQEALNPELVRPSESEKDQLKRYEATKKRVLDAIAKQKEFDNGVYFSHLKMNNPTLEQDKHLLARAKVNGEFRMQLPKILSSNERVTALAHENMAFYVHKKGNFFKIVKDEKNTKERRLKSQIERTHKIFHEFRAMANPEEVAVAPKPSWKDKHKPMLACDLIDTASGSHNSFRQTKRHGNPMLLQVESVQQLPTFQDEYMPTGNLRASANRQIKI